MLKSSPAVFIAIRKVRGGPTTRALTDAVAGPTEAMEVIDMILDDDFNWTEWNYVVYLEPVNG